MPRSDRAHRDNLSFNQLETIIFLEDPRFGHEVILRDRKQPGWSVGTRVHHHYITP